MPVDVTSPHCGCGCRPEDCAPGCPCPECQPGPGLDYEARRWKGRGRGRGRLQHLLALDSSGFLLSDDERQEMESLLDDMFR